MLCQMWLCLAYLALSFDMHWFPLKLLGCVMELILMLIVILQLLRLLLVLIPWNFLHVPFCVRLHWFLLMKILLDILDLIIAWLKNLELLYGLILDVVILFFLHLFYVLGMMLLLFSHIFLNRLLIHLPYLLIGILMMNFHN